MNKRIRKKRAVRRYLAESESARLHNIAAVKWEAAGIAVGSIIRNAEENPGPVSDMVAGAARRLATESVYMAFCEMAEDQSKWGPARRGRRRRKRERRALGR